MTHMIWLMSCFISHRMSNFSFSLHILTFWQFSYILPPWKLSSVHCLAYRCTHLGFYMWPTWKPPPPRHIDMWKLQRVGILHWPIWPKFSFCHFAETFLRQKFRIESIVSYHRRRDRRKWHRGSEFRAQKEGSIVEGEEVLVYRNLEASQFDNFCQPYYRFLFRWVRLKYWLTASQNSLQLTWRAFTAGERPNWALSIRLSDFCALCFTVTSIHIESKLGDISWGTTAF